MFENKFVSLPSHLKTIEQMEVNRESRTMCNTETSKVISRTDPVIPYSKTIGKIVCQPTPFGVGFLGKWTKIQIADSF